ncbi:hypothetical protein Dfri01_49620 [Dyadobacter frigoris]|uniref:2'-5' RNA ligase family protein n=2 Tax=Dyadobacter frigoris TaxID=2576211 RepID=A0A4U6D097_9BACT|nr:2'-5' RNA ligase family protein [Dyadobacter frigoris]GLU55501.1 hypothetical protein Dfri01_49620 [Dyadobacter frigoris]
MRRQLTLFLSSQNEEIEKIRAEFNPAQHELISAHVTLCRDNEIEKPDVVIHNIKTISLVQPLIIEFEPAERFENGKGVLIPARTGNQEFYDLREKVLKGIQEFNKHYLPHITLMHPRNSTCTDEIFDQIKKYKLPSMVTFDTISLIEQTDGGRWTIIEQFPIVKSVL